jgi:EAL domain-containing protein (putative c-di-GMP-specific phosphodiesterase class I)
VSPDFSPPSNRLSDAPNAPTDDSWGRSHDSNAALGRMVQPGHLSVVFQPIVKVETQELYAYEALVRCQLPEFRNPLVLFEHAVSNQCAGRLGRMIREIAVPLCSGKPLFLNVHPQELRESWLVRPDDPIFSHDHELYIEITESVPMTHFELCMSVLSEVRTRGGVRVVVDDLGAGYSNLKRIVDIEPAVVKLDRELIAGLHESQRQQQLVRRLVSLCGELSAQVVAEGVESRDELSALVDTGVGFVQGFLFARPAFPLPTICWPTQPPSAPGRRGRW